MKKKVYSSIFTVIFILMFLPCSAGAGLRVGVVMDNHSGPEYYPSDPSGNQCISCDYGQPYTDGFDHSADGFFAMKYFMYMLGSVQEAIPGFVIDSMSPWGAHHQGIILMDITNPHMIVDDDTYFDGTPYVPTLVDAWGQEGVYVDTSFPGADNTTGYITYTDLYENYDDTDGTPLYIWAQPFPYPTWLPDDYPVAKSAYNSGNVPFYLLPRDVMNSYEDANFDGGGSNTGYGPWWDVPVASPYLEGQVSETTGNYPDNTWSDMKGWEWEVNSSPNPDFSSTMTQYTDIDAWEEHDFFEFAGFSIQNNWELNGGKEVYNEEVTGMMNQIKSWIAANYDLTGTGPGTTEDLIYITYMIDPCFCDGVDPKTGVHGQSLFDAVKKLVSVQNVDKIVIHDHFISHSFLMNDDMGWRMINMAVDMGNMMRPGPDFSFFDDLVFAPGHPPPIYDHESGLAPQQLLADSAFQTYYHRFHIGENPSVKINTDCPGFFVNPPSWTTVTREEFVGGIALQGPYYGAIVDKMKDEYAWALNDGADDVALILSNHGTPTADSWCVDSGSDHAHYNHKLHYLVTTDSFLSDPAFGTTYPSISSITYGPDVVSPAEITALKTGLSSGMNGTGISTLSKNIKYCMVELSTGGNIILYRVSGQAGYTGGTGDCDFGEDPGDLSFSPREAINDIMDNQNPSVDINVTHIVDILFQFLGQSSDLLYDHRFDGYGEEHQSCQLEDGEICDPQVCDEQMYLIDKSLVYSNPLIDDDTKTNSWKNYQSIPEQYCYPSSGNPLPPYDSCWDFGHDDPSCPDPVPNGCYVSLFTVYDNATTDPRWEATTPNGLIVKITNGTWGFDEKVASSKTALTGIFDYMSVDSKDLGLVAKWKFEGDATDTSGYGNDGTASGGLIYVNDVNNVICGQAADFDGDNDTILVPDNATLNPTSAISIAGWIKSTDNNTNFIMAKPAGSIGGQYSLTGNMGNPGQVAMSLNVTGQVANVTSTSDVYNDNWHFICGTWDNSTGRMELYVDGVLEDNSTAHGSLNVTSGDIVFASNSAGNFYEMTLDEFRIFNYALSKSEIKTIMNECLCLGDFNDNGKVDGPDMFIIVSEANASMRNCEPKAGASPPCCYADANGNGKVDGPDMFIIVSEANASRRNCPRVPHCPNVP